MGLCIKLYIVDKKPVIALIRADKAVEETKLMNAVGGIEIRIGRGYGFDLVQYNRKRFYY